MAVGTFLVLLVGAAVVAVLDGLREWSPLTPTGVRPGLTWPASPGARLSATSRSTAIAVPPATGPTDEVTDGRGAATVSRIASRSTPGMTSPVTSVPAASSVPTATSAPEPVPLTSLVGSQVVVSDAGSTGLQVARSPSSSKLTWQSDPSEAVWVLRPGLSDTSCVSFESAHLPGQYIRYWTLTLWVDPYEATQDFHQMATFCPHAYSDGSYTFEAVLYPGKFLARSPDGTMIISPDATARRFYVRPQ